MHVWICVPANRKCTQNIHSHILQSYEKDGIVKILVVSHSFICKCGMYAQYQKNTSYEIFYSWYLFCNDISENYAHYKLIFQFPSLLGIIYWTVVLYGYIFAFQFAFFVFFSIIMLQETAIQIFHKSAYFHKVNFEPKNMLFILDAHYFLDWFCHLETTRTLFKNNE